MTRRWLRALQTWLFAGADGEFVLGDLLEGYAKRRRSNGVLVAAVWFGAMTLRSAVALRRGATRERAPFPRAWESLWADLRVGWRFAWRQPGISGTTAVVLALGVGAATFAFGVHHGTYRRGLPVSSPDRMMDVTSTLPDRGITTAGVSFDDYLAFAAAQTTTDEMALWDAYELVNLSAEGAPPERITATHTTSALHRLLEWRPHLGRIFTAADDSESAPRVAVLSHAFWQRRFGADPDIVGRFVTLDGKPVEVVGVLSAETRGFGEDVFLALRPAPATAARRAERDYYLLARLRPGVSVAQANEDFATIAARLESAFPTTNEGVSVAVTPFVDAWHSGTGATGNRLLTSVAALMLLIAVANVANLFLIRRVARSRELGIRLALGASGWRVARLVATESVAPVAAGAVGGALLAAFALDWYGARELAPWESFRFEAIHAGFAAAAAGAALAVIGVVTGGRRSSQPLDKLAGGTRGTTDRSFTRVSGALVIGEIALGGAALFVAGLMVKTAINLNTVDYGFAIDDVVTGTVQLDPARYPTAEARQALWTALGDRARALPGVERVALATQLPMIRYRGWSRFRLEGPPPLSVADYPGAYRNAITPGFFDTFDKTLLQGRPFTEADGPHTEPVVIVNEDFVQKFFPDGDALGRLIKLGGPASDRPWMRVVGVAPHMWMDTDVDEHPEGMYVPLAQFDTHVASLALRVSGSPDEYRDPLRMAIAAIDPQLPLDDAMTMSAVIHERTTLYRRTGPQFILFGAVALVLSTVGLYGVITYAARSHTREIGIRMALGAQRANVLRLILLQGATRVAGGIGLGVIVALYVSRGVSRFTFQLTPWDPAVLLVSFAVLGVTGLVATLLPARRATRVDPLIALRMEE